MSTKTNYLLLFFLFLLSSIAGLLAQSPGEDTLISKKELPKIKVEYGKKGFEFSTRDDNYLLQIESRFQFRFATPSDQNPLTYDELYDDNRRIFKINRARLKIGGHAFKPWLEYYWEYDIAQGNLLDFRLMIEKWDFFKIKIGQWKTYYNRERVISSGKQQTVDRSIITRPFTIDRQQGIEFYGRIFPETFADISYNLSLLTGMGRSATENDDQNLMYVGRLQYNLFGRELGFSGSDTDFHDKFTGLIAVAAATNRSPYTRFSTSGGGQLEGFEDGVDGQYRVNQQLIETAFMYRGFSWQNEFHFKEVYDHVNNETTHLKGAYFQAGYFFHHLWSAIPESLEFASRIAYYYPNTDINSFYEEEYGIAFNWFFKGHKNKLSAEFTYFDFRGFEEDLSNALRFRVQWDISF
ncbi:porin [Formosa sp. S-31]|uniref:porin n=1 Tax=Formosa sp. S-31 TaxID=2790949 RepID=UPI003EBCECF2